MRDFTNEISVSSRLNGIDEYYFSQKTKEIAKLKSQGKQIFNLGIGSPDLPPHPEVMETLRAATIRDTVHGYQAYHGISELRDAIRDFYFKKYGVILNAENEILPLAGSKEGIMHICMTFLNAGDEVLIPNPGYPTYHSAVKLAGGVPVFFDLMESNNWHPNIEALNKIDYSRVKMMFINYPNMPTGQLPDTACLQQIVHWCHQKNILLVHDNPYSLILNDEPFSLHSLQHAKAIVIELNSLSKSFNMAGWRVGMAIANSTIITQILRFKSNMDSGMFLPVQLAAAKALQLENNWFKNLNKQYAERRKLVFKLCDLLQCSYMKNQAGLFVWAKVNCEENTHQHPLGAGGLLSDQLLLEAGIFVTPGGVFGSLGENYIRFSLCANSETIQRSIQQVKLLSTNYKTKCYHH